ncbi:hypothetical protein [Micropruina sonneratiae]|uniref:hypothetical protein n=1 Tax=Micropruina sonneratiae TaxID=2986940 RepID=UPI00222628D4|nr:hypothetical protein [Micropruina sp. KQZ13P-5]MCW3158896.1 hypothetical protein [Micropruina sp. KQZ13P-5]
MNLAMGSQTFVGVEIPLLWGTRAVLQDHAGKLSVINLAGDVASLEVLADRPAPDISYAPTANDAFVIKKGEVELYEYNPESKVLTSASLKLPSVQVVGDRIQVGGSVFSNNMIVGAGVGIVVTETGISMGAPLPRSLAVLQV